MYCKLHHNPIFIPGLKFSMLNFCATEHTQMDVIKESNKFRGTVLQNLVRKVENEILVLILSSFQEGLDVR